MQTIDQIKLIVGMEIHVELATRTKMFSRALSPAFAGHENAEPNTYIDPVVLALPGALPVMNKAAIEMAMMVGIALNCSTAKITKWDRKSYFYPDLPKSYQTSQYDLPLSFDGAFDLPAADEDGFPDFSQPSKRIGITRAHLEEDAGKLLHEAPGGGASKDTLADYNRAGTPLLEIVTQPDFSSADDVVLFAKLLRQVCRYLGVTLGVMQKGHMRFEPNINCILTLSDGHTITTPIVEIKNLNSFKSLKAAIEFEHREQPSRWQADGRVMGRGMKTTRGWDDTKNITFVQREKEDAHDYRYFPDPDLLPVKVDAAWREAVAARIPELPLVRYRRYASDYALAVKEAGQLVEDRETSDYYEAAINALVELGIARPRAGKAAANILLQTAAKRANEGSGTTASTGAQRLDQTGVTAMEVAAIVKLREDGKINNQAVEVLFAACIAALASDATPTLAQTLTHVEALASEKGLLIVRDDAAMSAWIDQVLAANPKVAEDVKGGKVQAVGRLVGEVMKLAGGKVDAKTVREAILEKLG